jgi:hypothetical protein
MRDESGSQRRQRAFAARCAIAAGAWAGFAVLPRNADAFCRTTTCGLPSTFSPEDGDCTPDGFAAYCAGLNPPAKVLPLYWSNHCVSYDLHADAQGQVSDQVSYAVASQIAADAFAKWTETQCPTTTGEGRVSIDAIDLGPVSCDEVNYNEDQGNQHVIIFEDQGFGDGADSSTESGAISASTLGLTTVTFDTETGELYDADMQINSQQPLATGDPVPAEGYDLQSIVTHEAGHFLGLAHTWDSSATMYWEYTPGSSSKRILSDDDVQGICAIYPPDGTRAVDPSVSASGYVPGAACNPTPRHGFQSACTSPQNHGCDVAGEAAAPGSGPLAAIAGLVLGPLVARRKRGRTRGPRRA